MDFVKALAKLARMIIIFNKQKEFLPLIVVIGIL
jgi:hypothetical protein